MSPLDRDFYDGTDPVRDWTGRFGSRFDTHCHTTFSDERLRWLPGIVYHPMLEPEESYDLAKSRGMDFVTITDHDTIDGCKALVDRRGELPDFIFGEEVSVAFPDDGTVVHVNVFDHDEAQHREIQRRRGSIYELVDYVKQIGKVYSFNHLTWTEQHRVLSPEQLEAILELFPVFEGINGTRSYAHNAFVWQAVRGRQKTLIGGSDSHTDRIGTTYTMIEGTTKQEVLAGILAGRAAPYGAFGTPEKLRDDVWRVLQATMERRMAEASGRWERFVCRALEQFGKRVHPLVLLGYHKQQDSLIRGFVRALPGYEPAPA